MIVRISFGLVAAVLCMLVPASLEAFTAVEHRVSAPYEPQTLSGSIATEKILLGELTGDPHMYEFTVGEETTARFQLVQKEVADPTAFSLILVRVNEGNRGVEEIGRISTQGDAWQSYEDSAFGIALLQGDVFSAPLTPGLYRAEVSAAVNQGTYALVSGTMSAENGYFQKLSEIRTVQRFFGVSLLGMVLTPYVYIPLGFILLLLAVVMTRRYQKTLQGHA